MPPKVTIAASNDAVLPEDMLRHILVRLPAKTLCLFRAVCPSWRSLLSDPLFVAAHKSHHPEPLIVACNCEMFERGTINIMDLSGHVVKRIATTMKNARMVRTRRLDLICVTGHKGCHVINPATGDTFALPSCRAKEHAHVQHFFPESFDLGQVVTTGEYKALRCVSIDNFDHESSPMPVRWRGKQGPPAPVTSNRNRSIVVKGVVYFLLDFLYKRFTFSGVRVKPGSMALFNLETEEWMGIVQGPKPVRSFVKDSNGRCGYFSLYLELSLVNLDGFLVMAHNPEGCSLDLWFLMDSEKCLWNKSYSLDFQPENLFAQPLEILNDGKIVLSAPGSLRLYNPVTKTYIDFGMRNSTSVGTYTGSLLSSESTFTSVKAYDNIPRNVMWWALEKHKVPTKYITLIKDMYDNVVTSVRTSDVDTDDFPIKIGLHQGSALSPYLFALVMDEVTRDIQGDIPWCMLFADDVVLVDDSRTGTTGCEEEEVSLDGQVVPQKDTFRYLGSMLQEDGGIDEDVNHRIKAGWMKWRQASGILCDERVPQKLIGKFYRTAVRPTMLYGVECWSTKRRHVQQLGVAVMRMLRWMCGHMRKDRFRNDDIRDRVGVAPIEEKLVQHRLRWFGHIQRRPPEAPVHSGQLKRAEKCQERAG
ncbi:Retrovirus-related Pol polyprotein LINE-1 [Triticum urartu]|uniref:Retrovirus-related Pol polyprotein LINE-1 n=1 Tax=Triticum urartu TaxID=4572 RepID=M7ZBC2_TRIUA|nr:Retrovirus-related Pol polyprotein LINE-1 [Triticum urartu]